MNDNWEPRAEAKLQAELHRTIQKERRRAGFRGFLLGMLSTLLVVAVAVGGCAFYILKVDRRIYRSLPPAEEGLDVLDEDVEEKARKIQDYLDKNYLNGVDEKKLKDGVFRRMLSSLNDPYSYYYSKEEFEVTSSSDHYCGVGMSFQADGLTAFQVTEVYTDSPADKAGILPGDVLTAVNGEQVSGHSVVEISGRVRGKKGTKVVLTVLRDGKEMEFSLLRDEITVASIYSDLLMEDIGYIAINSFKDNTAMDFKEALKSLQEKNITSLIIDLRDNGGGYVNVAVDIIDQILPKGDVLYAEYKDGTRETFTSDASHKLELPIIVLVNQNTASASEIMSGALQDYKAATILGTKTYGKGVIQDVVQLEDGSGFQVTVAQYFTPKDHPVNQVGITPDVVLEFDRKANERDGSDNQLAKAIELLMLKK